MENQNRLPAWNSFPQISTIGELSSYFGEKRAYTHSQYFHYTDSKAMNSILEKKELWITSVKGFNDKIDKDQFADQQSTFALCFSTGENENLPMWYLYSGIKGDGARIRFTKTGIRTLINESTYYLVAVEGKNEIGERIPLKRDLDFHLEYGDVLYYKTGGSKNNKDTFVDLKYNTMTNYRKIKKSEFDIYVKSHEGFQKGLIWYYEKETRLVLRLLGKRKEYVENKNEQKFRIILSFKDDLLSKIKVTLAPNITDEGIAEICKGTGMQALLRNSMVVSKSEFAGTVNFDLCRKCERIEKSNG